MKRFCDVTLVCHESLNLKTGKYEVRLQTEGGCKIAVFEYAGHCQSAAHTINNHDALVDALDRALNTITDDASDLYEVLQKAKGES